MRLWSFGIFFLLFVSSTSSVFAHELPISVQAQFESHYKKRKSLADGFLRLEGDAVKIVLIEPLGDTLTEFTLAEKSRVLPPFIKRLKRYGISPQALVELLRSFIQMGLTPEKEGLKENRLSKKSAVTMWDTELERPTMTIVGKNWSLKIVLLQFIQK